MATFLRELILAFHPPLYLIDMHNSTPHLKQTQCVKQNKTTGEDWLPHNKHKAPCMGWHAAKLKPDSCLRLVCFAGLSWLAASMETNGAHSTHLKWDGRHVSGYETGGGGNHGMSCKEKHT